MLPTDIGSLKLRSQMTRANTYRAVGECIYCRRSADETELSKEHIIPYGLGGLLVLGAASCNDCATITGAFEGKCLGQIFGPVRVQQGFPQKRRGRINRLNAPTFAVTVGGSERRIKADEVPSLLVTFALDPPGILAGSALSQNFTGRPYIMQQKGFAARALSLFQQYGTSSPLKIGTPSHINDLGRMLAKIAHSYAVAELGVTGFKPYLLDIILGRDPFYLGHYVGGLFGDAPKGSDLHEIKIDETGFWGAKYVAVEIQLFSDRGLPTYLVIAGER